MDIEHRVEIDNRGHHALQWIAGGGIVVLLNFFKNIWVCDPSLARYVVICAATSLVCLILSLFLHMLRRKSSLLFQANSPCKHCFSGFVWSYWIFTILLLTLGYGILVYGMYSALSQPSACIAKQINETGE